MAHRSNCFLWAVNKLSREGGYIAMRRSKYCRLIPHFLWSKDLTEWWGFTPLHPLVGWKALLCCLWFEGSVKKEKADHGLL